MTEVVAAILCGQLEQNRRVAVTHYLTNEAFAQSVRQQIVSTAKAMLDGQLSFLLGSRLLAPLRHQTDASRFDQDFLVFVAIDSQTDALPLGAVREHWDQAALARLEAEIAEAEQWASTVGANACRSLIARFGKHAPNR
jgi:hypothetical protein